MEADRTLGSHDLVPSMRLNLIGEVRLTTAAGGDGPTLSGHQLSLVTFLRCCGPATRTAITDALWDGRPISARRVANLIAEVRAAIGRSRLPEQLDGRYQLNGIDTDADRFHRLVVAASEAASGDDPARLAVAATAAGDLLRGVPFAVGAGHHWTWLEHRPGLVAEVEATVSAGVAQLAGLALATGNPRLAGTVLEAGLLACPWEEDLVVMLAEVYLNQRRPGLACRLIDGWESRVRRLGFGEPSTGPRERLIKAGQTSIGSAVTTKLPR